MKTYPKSSLAARLYHLEVGEELLLLVGSSVQVTLNSVHTVTSTTLALAGRRYVCQKWLLVREGELPRAAVLVTRTAWRRDNSQSKLTRRPTGRDKSAHNGRRPQAS
jgi:hypothetical protein